MSMGVLTSILPFLPTCPGVYRMMDAQGRDLYIGKAKNLQKRVSSYTHLSRLPPRLQEMVHQVEQVRIITTEGEIEALLLEAQLIKAHGPTYNILLKNGYALPYLSLSNHLFPRLEISSPSSSPQSLHRRSASHRGSTKDPSQTPNFLWVDSKIPENPLEFEGNKPLGKIRKQDPIAPDHPKTRISFHLQDSPHSRRPQNPRSGVSSSLSRGGSLAPKNASLLQDRQAATGGGQAGGGSQGHQDLSLEEKPLREKHPTPWKMGPFLSRKPLILMKDMLHRGFLLRSCSDAIFVQRRTPCLQYHIQRCSAPCVGKITPEEYGEKMMEAKNFLGGKKEALQEKLEKKMKICALRHDYLQAKILRDQIWALRDVMPMQRAAAAGKADVVGWAQASEGACLHVVSWRDGATYGCESFFFDGVSSLEGPLILSQFLCQFYTHHAPPPRLILPFLPQDWEDFSLLMRHRFQVSPHGVVPKRGPLFALGKRAQEQAADALRLHNQSRGVQRDLLAQATALFSWPALPQRIEIYDNSHLQGTAAVGVMVVYTPPHWDKKSYRTWSVEGAEDCAMMREVMRRRFEHKTLPLPDAMIIDGGKGQLSAVKSVLGDLGLSIPLLGIAKTPGKDTLILAEGKALDLPTHHPLLHWVQGLRDEAHAFALRTHRRKRQAKTLPPSSRSRPSRPKTPSLV